MNLDKIREQHRLELESYQRLPAEIGATLRTEALKSGIVCTVEWRAKDTVSVLRKVVLDNIPYGAIVDKAGARIKLRYVGDLDRVEEIIRNQLVIEKRLDRSEKLEPNEFGYAGIHYHLRVKPSDERKSYHHLVAELQVHTDAQSL